MKIINTLLIVLISALLIFIIGAEGCAPVIKCNDSDSGKVYDVQGTVAFGNISLTDFCTGKQITEYYCDNNSIVSENYSCIYKCNEGACALPASLTNACVTAGKGYGCSISCSDDEDEISELNAACGADRICCKIKPCFDSDYGINETLRGTVSGVADNIEFSYEDKCESNVTLMEYYCENDSAVSTKISCPKSCRNGRCSIAG